MICVVDKNTNRIIYTTDNGGRFLLDQYTYRFDCAELKFIHPLWEYRVEKRTIVHVPGVKKLNP